MILGFRGGDSDLELVRRGMNVSVITSAETTFVDKMVVKFERRVEEVAVPGCRPKMPAFRTRMSRCP